MFSKFLNLEWMFSFKRQKSFASFWFFHVTVETGKNLMKKTCSDNLRPYQVNFFPNSTFPTVQESLLWENLPFHCLSMTVCCLSRASVFPMVCFRQVHDCQCKRSLTWRNSLFLCMRETYVDNSTRLWI